MNPPLHEILTPLLYENPMTKTSDINERAKRILDIASGDKPDTPPKEKDPAAVALGRKGGLAKAKKKENRD